MKLLKTILHGLAGLVALLVVVSFFIPSAYKVERSVTVAADPSKIFPYVNNLQQWPSWSPWTVENYPTMKYTYSGPSQGIGATSTWTEESGNGKLVITASDSVKGIEYDLEFDEGQMKSKGAIVLESLATGTKVTWRDAGDVGMSPIGKYFTLFLDSMIGSDFQKGLDKLKKIVES